MIQIKSFIDKIAYIEGRQRRDVVLTIEEARALRDEITKLLLEQKTQVVSTKSEPIEIVLKGGNW
jgi:hypothetical protein